MYLTILLVLLFSDFALAGQLYSYVNEQGVRVYSNIGVRSFAATNLESSRRFEGHKTQYGSLIRESALRHQIDANLVKAIISAESDFNPQAVSSKGCIGLMQLHPDTATRFGVHNSFDPAENIEGGVRYLRFLMQEFVGDLDLVLAAYNAGESAVTRYNGIPPYRETQQYVSKVTALYESLGPRASGSPRPRGHRLKRVRLADGSILFTNWADPR